MTCDHEWVLVEGSRTHFRDEPNSRIRHKPVRNLLCVYCAQRGFRYLHISPVTKKPSQVVYTWDPEDAKEPGTE